MAGIKFTNKQSCHSCDQMQGKTSAARDWFLNELLPKNWRILPARNETKNNKCFSLGPPKRRFGWTVFPAMFFEFAGVLYLNTPLYRTYFRSHIFLAFPEFVCIFSLARHELHALVSSQLVALFSFFVIGRMSKLVVVCFTKDNELALFHNESAVFPFLVSKVTFPNSHPKSFWTQLNALLSHLSSGPRNTLKITRLYPLKCSVNDREGLNIDVYSKMQHLFRKPL